MRGGTEGGRDKGREGEEEGGRRGGVGQDGRRQTWKCGVDLAGLGLLGSEGERRSEQCRTAATPPNTHQSASPAPV